LNFDLIYTGSTLIKVDKREEKREFFSSNKNISYSFLFLL
jgi:hypothetical protein